MLHRTTVFGWVHRATGLAALSARPTLRCPERTVKVLVSAVSGLYMLSADGEQGAEVYSAATTRDQAAHRV